MNKIKRISVQLIIFLKYRKLFKIFKKTKRLLGKIHRKQKVAYDESNDFSKILIFFVAKIGTTTEAIHLLCKKGFGKDALVLLRTVFESFANFKYMHENKKEVQKFLLYELYEKKRMCRSLLDLETIPVNKQKITKQMTQLECEWRKVKHNFEYQDKKGKKQIMNSWSGKNLASICDKIGMKEEYDMLYRYASLNTNPTTSNALAYILGVTPNKKNITLEIGMSQKLVKQVLSSTTEYFLLFLQIINEEYNLEFKDDIKLLLENLKKTTKKHKTHATTESL